MENKMTTANAAYERGYAYGRGEKFQRREDAIAYAWAECPYTDADLIDAYIEGFMYMVFWASKRRVAA